ncbi:hypothetical protein EU245_14810 [Lentibacillus lipolyticus]|nr:hypothetical protein EU245_14810 [Lentibacillus lipolyticus]
MDSATKLFVNHLKKAHGIKVNHEEVVSEAVTLYKEELDHEVFPTEYLKELSDPLLFVTMVYVDQQEQEWIFCLATKDDSHKWLHAVCLKDGELVDRNVPLKAE